MYCNEWIRTSPKDDCFIANLSWCSKSHPKSSENLQIKSCCYANKCMWNSRMLWEVFSLKPFPLLQTHRWIMLKQCGQNSPTANMCLPYCNSLDQAKKPVATSSLTIHRTHLSWWCRRLVVTFNQSDGSFSNVFTCVLTGYAERVVLCNFTSKQQSHIIEFKDKHQHLPAIVYLYYMYLY